MILRTPGDAPVPLQHSTKRDSYTAINPLHASSTVNANDLAVHPVTIHGSEEADHTGDIDRLTNTVARRPCHGILVDLLVAELVTSRNVLAAHSVVHIGLDATGGNTVDSNLLLTSIWFTLVSVWAKLQEFYIPTAMQRTKVSMAPLEPE
jgi:hypothetical protein